MSQDNNETIKYVEIEAVTKGVGGEVVKGLFLGAGKNHDGDETSFVRLWVARDTYIYLSPAYYNILTVSIVYDDDAREDTFFRSDETDQKLALFKITSTLVTLREQKLCSDKGEVNLKLYRGTPTSYGLGKGVKQTDTTATSGVSSTSNGAAENIAKVAGTVKKEQKPVKVVKPEDPVAFMKRRTKKPTPDFLKSLKKKVGQITEGEYEAPDLPVIKEKKAAKKQGSNSIDVINSELDHLNTGANCGDMYSDPEHWN